MQEDFLANLDVKVVENIEKNLDISLLNYEGINENKIDEIVGNVNTILLDSAKKVGMIKNAKHKEAIRRKKVTKPWFNETCKFKRKQFLKARKRANTHKGSLVFNIERKRLAKD